MTSTAQSIAANRVAAGMVSRIDAIADIIGAILLATRLVPWALADHRRTNNNEETTMDTLKNHFTEQRDAINAKLERIDITQAETDALRAHVATLDGVIKLLDYVVARRDESATEQDNGQSSTDMRAAHRHKCVAYSNVVGAIRRCFDIHTNVTHVAYIDDRDESGPCRRYATESGASSTALALAKRFDTAEEARAELDKSNDYWRKEGKTLEVDDVLPTPAILHTPVATTGPSIE